VDKKPHRITNIMTIVEHGSMYNIDKRREEVLCCVC
jgi:hypothetical protein